MVHLAVWITGVSTLAACIALGVDPFQLRHGVLPGYPFEVQGEVEGILEETERSNTAAVKITHVFVGPDELVGRTFTTTGYDALAQGSFGAGHQSPKLHRGEVGIWCVYERDSGLFGAVATRKSVSQQDYQKRLEVAQTMESVANLGSETAQVEVLERYAREGTPAVSSWAINRLRRAVAKHPEVRESLLDLADDQRLSIAAQVALDETLVEAAGAAWAGSDRRLQLLQKWASAKLSGEDADLALGRLQRIPQHPEREALSQESLLRLVKIAAFNEGLPGQSRELVGAILFWVARNYENREAVFDLALEILQRAKGREMELAGARVLRNSLKDEVQKHRDEVLAARQATKDPLAVRLLDEALQPSQSTPRRPDTP